jgi:GTP-binding protein
MLEKVQKGANQTRVEFVASAFTHREFPRAGMPEVVMAGRSNVGKSSLINRLVGIKGLARTSATPGKTRSINFYRCNGSFFLVDLPGFGFAKGKSGSREWKSLVERYFERGATVTLAIHLVDARMPPTDLDIQFADWLESLNIPRLVVATKADKISGNQRAMEKRAIAEVFAEEPVIFSSAVTGAGCREIWKRVVEATQIINLREIAPRV